MKLNLLALFFLMVLSFSVAQSAPSLPNPSLKFKIYGCGANIDSGTSNINTSSIKVSTVCEGRIMNSFLATTQAFVFNEQDTLSGKSQKSVWLVTSSYGNVYTVSLFGYLVNNKVIPSSIQIPITGTGVIFQKPFYNETKAIRLKLNINNSYSLTVVQFNQK